jgi:broad specificity phosphatase PhoE
MTEEQLSIHAVTFLRHGESVGNLENRHQGHADFPLTDIGRQQALSLAKRWRREGRGFDRALSSPLLRARQTAEIICERLFIPLEFDPDLMETENGLLKGLKEEEARVTVPHPEYMTPYSRFGRTGESRWEVFLRGGRFIQSIIDRPPAQLLVVSHGGILNTIMYALLGIPLQADFTGPRFQFNNTAYADFTYTPRTNNWRLLAFDPGCDSSDGKATE